MFLTLADLLPIDLWLWPWIPSSRLLLKMYRWACRKHEGCCWFLFPGLVSASLPSQFPLLPAKIFPIPTMAEHTMPSLSGGFVISRKAEYRAVGNHCCWAWPWRASFPYWLFFFPASWGFGGIDIKALSLYCFMEIHLSETLGIIVVQNESRYLIVSPLITEMERLETLICLLFFLL